jgi:hypothetical protein
MKKTVPELIAAISPEEWAQGQVFVGWAFATASVSGKTNRSINLLGLACILYLLPLYLLLTLL